MGDRRRQSLGEVALLLPPGADSAPGAPPEQPEPPAGAAQLSRRRAASITAFFLLAGCSLLLLLSQSPTVWRAMGDGGLRPDSYDRDQDVRAASLLSYGGGRHFQRVTNHTMGSYLSPSTKEDEMPRAMNAAGRVVSAATNPTTSPATQRLKSQGSSLVTKGASYSTMDRGTAVKSLKLAEPIFGTPIPGDSHIIFVETSCALTDSPLSVPFDSESGLRLSPRAACALEAAARAHPERRVYLLHTCPVRRAALRPGRAPAYALAALSLPNARLWQQPYSQVFAGSPLERWLSRGALWQSAYPVIHAADVLRFVVLWKYGGTYLDTDVLMLRSLGETRDFACPESDALVSIGAMDMSRESVGRLLADLCLNEERINFNPNQWGYNGPGAITRALRRLCQVDKVSQMTPDHCGGYKILPTSAFYPIPYSQWIRYFRKEGAEKTLDEVRDSLGVHVWNALSHDEPVYTDSKQPYAQIARQVCPSVVSALNGTM